MMRTTTVSAIFVGLSVLGLSACDTSGLDLAALDPSSKQTTVRTTTVGINYSSGTMTTEQAQDAVRGRCDVGEVVSVTQPVVQATGKLRIEATCMATYDKNGNLIPNQAT